MNKSFLLGSAATLLGAVAVIALASAQTASVISTIQPLSASDRQIAVNGLASGDVIYGPAVHTDPTTTLRNIVINHPFEPATFGAVTVYNASTTNTVTIRQVVDGVAHQILPGQTLAFPMRLELGRQIGVQFNAPGSDNKIYWVIRNFQIRPTDL